MDVVIGAELASVVIAPPKQIEVFVLGDQVPTAHLNFS